MGCTIECSICCKKRKKDESKIKIERKDTKFVAERFQHLKIEIKNNNNSNSKEIPLINNFFKETLGRKNSSREKSKSSNSKNEETKENKNNNQNKSNNDLKTNKENKENEENKENKDIKTNKENKEIQNLVDENAYKGINEQNSEDLLSNSNKSRNSKKTKESNKTGKLSFNSNTKKDNKIIDISKSNRTNKSKKSKSKELNKSKSKESKSSNLQSKESNTMKASNKSKKLKNSNNLNKSNELSNLIEQNNNSITNNKTSNLNTSVNILNESYIKKNNLNKLTKISKHNSKVFKSNKEMSQIFVDYKTFIKGKPYSELSQEYKQGIEIGEGGFGKVRTIIHKKTGQLRAMKLIKKSKEFNLDEIENLMLLNHPNILKLFEYYYDEEENIYIITEYIRGEELFNKIQEVYRFSEEDSAIIIKSVLQAITYCHSRGIIHRDLKPENILIPSGSNKVDYTLLKIIDFGASVLKKDDGKISFRFGTPYYIAPEVLQESYNEKCDVWSIGVILYLLLIGQAPFDGEDDDIICQKIISEEIDYENNKKIKELSNEAVDFMKKLLEKNPDKRISSAQALEHVWLKKYAPHTKVNKAFSKKIYKNLSNFREQSQLSTAVTTFMTNYLMNDDELKLLKKLFFELDVKGVGVITRDELYRGMVECFGDKITREEVDKIFSNIDYDNNGTISFDEFVKAAIDKKKLLTEEKLKAAFSLFDRNGDGDIEAKELKEVIGDDSNIDNNVWLQMIREVDLDGNGVIDFEEFKDMMQKLCS